MSETGLNTCFRSLYRQSLPGSRVNEDGCGLLGRYAWIVDGATGVSAGRVTSGPSDAAWLAGMIGEKLASLREPERSAEKTLFELQMDLGEAFDAAVGQTFEIDDHMAPSACLGLVGIFPLERAGYRLEGSFLGDVVALVPTREGIVRWTDERAKPFEQRTLAALGAGGHEPGLIPEGARRQILENRSKLNSPDGYWVVHPRRAWAGRELRFTADIAPSEPIVLATDGFMRLVDIFGVHTDASLHVALAVGRGDELMQELRGLERRDDMADAYRRVKTHDDATVLVIAAEPCG
ncbi:hypothetical protein [Microvirga sp. 2TAF3]|uniref:hypothetical protein n=1 Tax=Microvirga sp. 2TAF3 TaxID=3233014 RepID=UPI003F966959